jgi:hypothetical protein
MHIVSYCLAVVAVSLAQSGCSEKGSYNKPGEGYPIEGEQADGYEGNSPNGDGRPFMPQARNVGGPGPVTESLPKFRSIVAELVSAVIGGDPDKARAILDHNQCGMIVRALINEAGFPLHLQPRFQAGGEEECRLTARAQLR